jgi:Domain of unknown function (DUF1905)/Bacteriocin-protection, YdeI or OmpD-Associated
MTQTFTTTILQGTTKDTTGIEVPTAVITALGGGKKPLVKVTLNGYTYRSSVATMNGKFMVGLSKENRQAAQVAGGETLEITLELDTEPRMTPIPDDLGTALHDAGRLEKFEQLSASKRKEHVHQVEEAKTAETRERRIAKVIASL